MTEEAEEKPPRKLHVLPGISDPRPEAPDPQLVQILREQLADAEAGQLRSFIGVGIERDGGVVTIWAGEVSRNRFSLLGGLSRLHTQATHRLFPNDEDYNEGG